MSEVRSEQASERTASATARMPSGQTAFRTEAHVRRLLFAAALPLRYARAGAGVSRRARSAIIVPFPAGGTADIMPRIFGEKLAAKWGQPVVVDNRPGAAGNIGAELVYRAEPDGYTLLSAPPPPLVINPSLYPKLAFDPARFVPVSVMGAVPNVLLVHPKVPASERPGADRPRERRIPTSSTTPRRATARPRISPRRCSRRWPAG